MNIASQRCFEKMLCEDNVVVYLSIWIVPLLPKSNLGRLTCGVRSCGLELLNCIHSLYTLKAGMVVVRLFNTGMGDEMRASMTEQPI